VQDRRAQAQASAAAATADATAAASALFGRGDRASVAQAAGTIVNANAAAVQTAVTVTSAAIEDLWHATDPYDNAAVQDFAQQAGRLVVSAQRSVAQTTSASQAILARTVGLRAPGAVRIPDDVRGAHITIGSNAATVHPKSRVTVKYQPDTKGGKPTRVTVIAADAHPDQIFNRAAVVYRYRESQGADAVTASRASVQRIEDIVDGNLMLAQRLAEQQSLKQAGAKFYRRVIHPELSRGGVCGLCVAASDRRYRVEVLKPIHLRCKCGVVGVGDDADPGYELNRSDLRMLYDEGGEAAKNDDGRYTSAKFEAHVIQVEANRRQRGKAPLGQAYWDKVARTRGENLKKTRYAIVDHAELGPTLVRVSGEKVPFYKVAAAA